ncbi:hypothetical protein R75777_08103 [Paraburkholderia nemoris]|nr:hypothetical protein R75777_08103 [Paraburkholderia nemoris]
MSRCARLPNGWACPETRSGVTYGPAPCCPPIPNVIAPANSTGSRRSLLAGSRPKRPGLANSEELLSRFTRISARWVSPAPMIASRRLPDAGDRSNTSRRRRPDAGRSFPSGLLQAKRSSSTGARTGPSSTASAPSCRSRNSSSATAAPSSCVPTCCRLTRCCSTPIIMRSLRGAAFHAAASTTT